MESLPFPFLLPSFFPLPFLTFPSRRRGLHDDPQSVRVTRRALLSLHKFGDLCSLKRDRSGHTVHDDPQPSPAACSLRFRFIVLWLLFWGLFFGTVKKYSKNAKCTYICARLVIIIATALFFFRVYVAWLLMPGLSPHGRTERRGQREREREMECIKTRKRRGEGTISRLQIERTFVYWRTVCIWMYYGNIIYAV